MVRSIVFAVLGLIVFLGALLGTAALLFGAYEQSSTVRFTQVEAVVNSSDVTSHRGSKGRTTYRWSVRYTFHVNGQPYSSSRKAFGMSDNTGHGSAHADASAYPAGSLVKAYYDPADPSRSVLRRGAGWHDFFPAGLAGGIIPLGAWLIAHGVRAARESGRPLIAARLPVLDFGDRVCVSLSSASPFASGFLAAAAAMIGGTIANGEVTGKLPDMVLIGQGMVVVLSAGLGVAAAMWASSLRLRPAVMMTFDRRAGTLTLPKGEGRHQPLTLRCAEVEDFDTESYEMKTSKGAKYTMYRVVAAAIGDTGLTVRHKVKAFNNEAQAESLAQWSRERLLEAAAAGM